MTISSGNILSGPYTGTGSTAEYSYGFKITDDSQLEVKQFTDLGVESTLVLGTDYTVAGVGVAGGGTITLLAGNLPTDYQLYIRSNYTISQLTAFRSQGGFSPGVHEDAFDKLTRLVQQLDEEISRAVKVTIISGADPDALIASIEASEAAAAVSAAAAAVSAAAADADAILTAADVVSTGLDVGYAAEWANKAEDSLVSAAAGGDEVDDYSAKHHANKAANSASTSADLALSVAGTDTYTATLGVSSYVTGKTYYLSFANTNTSTTPTLNLDSLGAKTIKNLDGSALVAGAIPNEAFIRYNGTDMILLNPVISQATYPVVLTKLFTSAEQTLTTAGSLTIAHGLGVMPTLLQARLICKTAELGYSIGDELVVNPGGNDIGGSLFRGVSIVPDSTNINIRYGNNPSIFSIINKTTGDAAGITAANWKLIVRAWV